MSSIIIEIPDDVKSRGEKYAEDDGESLEEYVIDAFLKKLEQHEQMKILQERAKRGSREKFDAVLASVPDAPPEPGDEVSPELRQRIEKMLETRGLKKS